MPRHRFCDSVIEGHVDPKDLPAQLSLTLRVQRPIQPLPRLSPLTSTFEIAFTAGKPYSSQTLPFASKSAKVQSKEEAEQWFACYHCLLQSSLSAPCITEVGFCNHFSNLLHSASAGHRRSEAGQTRRPVAGVTARHP